MKLKITPELTTEELAAVKLFETSNFHKGKFSDRYDQAGVLLAMCVRRLLRKQRGATVTKPDAIEINEDRHEVFVKGVRVKLATKEYNLLTALKNSGNTLSREDLTNLLWADKKRIPYDSRTVDQHVARLRRKLGKHGGSSIVTITGFGYRFDGIGQ